MLLLQQYNCGTQCHHQPQGPEHRPNHVSELTVNKIHHKYHSSMVVHSNGSMQHCGQYTVCHITRRPSLLLEDDTCSLLIYCRFPFRADGGSLKVKETQKVRTTISQSEEVINDQGKK